MGSLGFTKFNDCLPFLASGVVRIRLGALCKGNIFSTTELCLILKFYPDCEVWCSTGMIFFRIQEEN